jgi:hypothetical protein
MSSSADPPVVPPLLGGRIQLPVEGLTHRELLGRDLTDAEAAEIVELLRRAYNGGPNWFEFVENPLDHFIWRVRDCAFATRARIMERGSEIVGYAWQIRRRYLIGGRKRVALDGGDLGYDPSLQGRGVFSAVERFYAQHLRDMDDIDLELSVSTHPTVIRSERAAPDYVEIGNNIRHMIRPLDIARMIARGEPSAAEGASRTSIALAARGRRVPKPAALRGLVWRLRALAHRLRRPAGRRSPRTWTLRTVERFEASADGFFAEASAGFDLIQVRDATYLNWRYCDRRAGPFVVRAAEEHGRLLGYCAVVVSPTRAILADLLALPGRLDVAADLVEDALEHFRRERAPAVMVRTVERHPYNEIFARAGFLPKKAVAILQSNTHSLDAPTIELMRNPACRIHFMYGDTDHV